MGRITLYNWWEIRTSKMLLGSHNLEMAKRKAQIEVQIKRHERSCTKRIRDRNKDNYTQIESRYSREKAWSLLRSGRTLEERIQYTASLHGELRN